MTEYLGWAATAVFVCSYFARNAGSIRRVQMIGALMWTAYGAVIQAYPVVVANLLVFLAAAWTMRAAEHASRRPAGQASGS
jgi:hypothetical protein